MRAFGWFLFLLVLPVFSAPEGPFHVEITPVSDTVLEQRLDLAAARNPDRRAALENLFREAGCTGDRLREQPVSHEPDPNVVCSLPGLTARTIVIGGHYDKVVPGMGTVDDWSGVALLPSLYQALQSQPRRHRFVFAGFALEEVGLLGSREFVHNLTGQDRRQASAMINLECLGLGPVKVWASRADPKLLNAYVVVLKALQMSPGVSNVDDLGDDDSHPFLQAGIPVLTIHSVTHENVETLHSSHDNRKAIRAADYFASYRVAATFLAYLDTALD